MSCPLAIKRRVKVTMSSCNAVSVNCAIRPTNRGVLTSQRSCNAGRETCGACFLGSSSFTVTCAEQVSCNVPRGLRGGRFQ